MNGYQLALRTPGMYPDSARSLKQILQTPNFLRNARDLPHAGSDCVAAPEISASFAFLYHGLTCHYKFSR
jgi:hypothetical protein